MNEETNLATKYYESVLLNKRLVDTEFLYWNYKFYVYDLRAKNKEFNKNLENSISKLREDYMKERLK